MKFQTASKKEWTSGRTDGGDREVAFSVPREEGSVPRSDWGWVSTWGSGQVNAETLREGRWGDQRPCCRRDQRRGLGTNQQVRTQETALHLYGQG